jgi:hypothetical protein
MSVLQEKMEGCSARHDYVQGCRHCSGDALLQLRILQECDYFLKVDSDVFFYATIPFNMLHDMRIQGSVFGHTGDFTHGPSSCTRGIKAGGKEFQNMATGYSRRPEWAAKINWKGPCSAGVAKFERSVDECCSNFIVLETEFWQSEPVRAFGKCFHEIYPGFF